MEKELRAAFAKTVKPILDQAPQPDAKPKAPTLTPQPPQEAREPSAEPSLQKPQGTPAAAASRGVAALIAARLAGIGAAVAAGWDRIVQFFTF